MDNFLVVSSDCHAGLPIQQYREYLDPQYREVFDMAVPIELELADKASKTFLIKEINEQWRKGVETELTGAWDHDHRIGVLDRDGIAVEVIFPDGVTETNTPPFGAGIGLPTGPQIVPDLQWAGAQAHNRWLAEFCAKDPIRHIGLAVVPVVWDIPKAVEEARWAAANGLRGVVLPLLTGAANPSYNHTRYHPFWQACEDLGLIVHFHSGGGPMEDFFGADWPNEEHPEHVGAVGCFVSEALWWTYRPLSFLIWGGVFETFPKLKVAITEAGTGWMIPPWLRLLDHMYTDEKFSAKMGDFSKHLSMSPSAYFRRNVGIGASCISRADAELRHEMGLNQIMWGSDYPHPEGSWPLTHEHLMESFRGIPEPDVALMLGENAVNFYGIDREAVLPIAARVGPKKSEFVAASAAH